MTVLADTSVLLSRGLSPDDTGPFAVSVVTVGELHAGIAGAPNDAERLRRQAFLFDLLGNADVLPVTVPVAARYGEMRAATGRGPTNDLWIAATAAVHRLTLLTADDQQARTPGVDACLVGDRKA